jgi:predicted transposase/invertase (TIGR01784 family)
MTNISPRVDIVFKKIFGIDDNKDLLISLINSIVSIEDQVSEVVLLNPYNPKNFRQDKLSVLDIKATGNNGKKLNIQIQIGDEANYDKKALYYWAKLYSEQFKVAEDYSSLSKAIGIHILNFTSIPLEQKYHNVFHIAEKESGLLYFKDLELHTIELKKFSNNFNEQLVDILAKVRNKLDMWVTFLTRSDLLKVNDLPENLNDIYLKKAIKVLDVMNFSSEERGAYENHLKWLKIEVNTLKKAESIAKAEGKIEGKAEGKLEGKIEIAQNLIAKGFDENTIFELTGFTKQEIKKYFS